ncbi:Annexin A7 [Madurella mycetomatis]|uniref:Annexin A7 n=1 Tax=Madurella mycetomatis TaxID=100816 RepID=A0A175VVZ3_9PEZI|nr:Annexin A7 [Madurella mycetomatis]
MSLQVDDSSRRGRSRSPSGRRDDEGRDRSRARPPSVNIVDAVPYPSSTDAYRDPSSAAFEYERLSKWPSSAAVDGGDYYRGPPRGGPADDPYSDARREVQYVYDRERDRDRDRDRDSPSSDRERPRARESLHLPQKYAAQIKTVEPPDSPRESRDSLRSGKERESSRERKERERRRRKEKLEEDLAYGKLPGPSKYAVAESPPTPTYVYAKPKPWEYEMPEEARYSDTYLDPAVPPGGRAPSPGPAAAPAPGGATIKPAIRRDRSPQPPTGRMSMLSVQTPHHSASLSLSSAPPSPLLEAYHGTYQSMSPMPSPLLLPTTNVQVLEALSPIASDDERDKTKRSARRARFHDPVDDAARLAKALKGERRAPETEPLIEILPGLTHEQVMELRTEYKRLVKTGGSGGGERKGVNVAKHIRARLKDEDPTLMKVCYATALGRWESEAYWANFWYHGDKTRRELLIEALMGRTNEEIRAIKEGFSDKKYGNSLVKCMKTELKEDKFKKAVLMVLEETRMEEVDTYGRPARIDYDLVVEDAKQLWRAVGSERGGESLMIEIVTQRSDAHLREVLREYRERYKGANFAKDALRKSGNLVGEVLAHILNGVINKPVRDAMLLHHALTASRRDELRRELLISRLVRYHWDAAHMALVRRVFREQYGRDLQDAVREATKGEWGEFCVALCIVRMPDDVRRVARVDIHR